MFYEVFWSSSPPKAQWYMLHQKRTPMPLQAIGAFRSAHFRRVSPSSATVGPHLHNIGRDRRNTSDAARQGDRSITYFSLKVY